MAHQDAWDSKDEDAAPDTSAVCVPREPMPKTLCIPHITLDPAFESTLGEEETYLVTCDAIAQDAVEFVCFPDWRIEVTVAPDVVFNVTFHRLRQSGGIRVACQLDEGNIETFLKASCAIYAYYSEHCQRKLEVSFAHLAMKEERKTSYVAEEPAFTLSTFIQAKASEEVEVAPSKIEDDDTDTWDLVLVERQSSTSSWVDVDDFEHESGSTSNDAPWRLLFADESSSEISAIAYESSGDYIATGYISGIIRVYARLEDGSYVLIVEFQSHKAEFACPEDVYVYEHIEGIAWCHRSHDALYLLSTSRRVVKYWKIQLYNSSIGSSLARVERVYENIHGYHIHSISKSSDGETFLSADDLRINLQRLDRLDQSNVVLDVKPLLIEDLAHVITSARFHPLESELMIYSTSQGHVKLGDLRQTASLTDANCVTYASPVVSSWDCYSEVAASIIDTKYTPDGRYIVARDYMSVKVWDVKMNSRPVHSISVCEHLRPRLPELYETNRLFGRFRCATDGKSVVTGIISWTMAPTNSSDPQTKSRNNWTLDDDVILLAQIYADPPFEARKGGAMDAWNELAELVLRAESFGRGGLDGKKAQNRFFGMLKQYESNDSVPPRVYGASATYEKKRELLDKVTSR
ncbi:hypothetical protein Poli38472_004377 [Pythium oligandrum]|uniref:Uncharacterized protein n=1 Tax=Pythium oligandrum TaxID=41045 RepID=A0A8K1FI19_PYTOL|nr:hypothetical protein Poli38472_004377 [Pythium oligandrum]|eukprot:TMW59308.1 hypothetical protein Poli38472_004377 [Pythium oligandrum]